MDFRTLEKYVKMGRTYGLKSLEINDNHVKIEFMETKEVVVQTTPVVDKKVTEYLAKQKDALLEDELSIMNPEAFEDKLASQEET